MERRDLEWQQQSHPRAVGNCRLNTQLRTVAVECGQPLEDVAETEATTLFASPRIPAVRTDAVVLYHKTDEIALLNGGDFQMPRTRPAPQTVAQRVLHHRLQNQGGHGGLGDFRGYVELDPETVAKAGFLDIEISAQKLHLFADGNHLLRRVREHVAEDAREAQSHDFGAGRIGGNQVGNGVEGIEQKMRIDLGTEGSQFGFGDLLLEHSLAIPAVSHFRFEAQQIEARTELQGHAAQVVDFVAHQSPPGRTGSDSEDRTHRAPDPDRDQQLKVRHVQLPGEPTAACRLNEVGFMDFRRPGFGGQRCQGYGADLAERQCGADFALDRRRYGGFRIEAANRVAQPAGGLAIVWRMKQQVVDETPQQAVEGKKNHQHRGREHEHGDEASGIDKSTHRKSAHRGQGHRQDQDTGANAGEEEPDCVVNQNVGETKTGKEEEGSDNHQQQGLLAGDPDNAGKPIGATDARPDDDGQSGYQQAGENDGHGKQQRARGGFAAKQKHGRRH